MLQRKRCSRQARREAVSAYLFILPLLLGLGVFNVYSFGVNIYYSFTNKSSFGTPNWVGLKNYIDLFQNEKFYSALSNTFKYVVICVPCVVILSIFVAVLLNTNIRGRGVYRTLVFLPAVTMPAAIGLIWKWIFNYEFGILNHLLSGFGIEKIAWLSDPEYVLLSVCVVVIWADVSTRVIILLAGLQNIPDVYYEAARIDGANSAQIFFRITLPQLSPSIFFVTVMEIIGIFQIFDFIFLMIPRSSSGVSHARSLVSYFYEAAFQEYKKGYGAAITLVLFLIILVVTIFQMWMQKKWVHYE